MLVMGNNVVLCDSPNLTEREFFRREFGLDFSYSNPKHLAFEHQFSNGRNLIASTKPQVWLETLRMLPKESVIFFLLGNETYEPEIFNSLNDLECLNHVFIYNPPTRLNSINHWYSLVGDFVDQFPKIKPRQIIDILRDNRTSRHLRNKFHATDLRYSWSPFPQGYSNSFVAGLEAKEHIPKHETTSLVNEDFVSDLQINFHKNRQYFFVGQRTNRRRDQITFLLERRVNSKLITKHTGFGGTIFDGDSSYVDFLLTSWFNVIPPGHFNNSNHRYTESCIAGSIPVILHHNSIDHSDNNNWTQHLSALNGHSFKNLMRFLDRLDDEQLHQLAHEIRTRDFDFIHKTRKALKQFLNS
jgi:hypothetical protein